MCRVSCLASTIAVPYLSLTLAAELGGSGLPLAIKKGAIVADIRSGSKLAAGGSSQKSNRLKLHIEYLWYALIR